MKTISRRSAIKKVSLASASLLGAPALFAGKTSPSEKFTLGVIGIRGRGGNLLRGFVDIDDVEVATICDVDDRVLAERGKDVEERQGKKPAICKDFRRILDDPSIDAIVLGTPDHWHAIPSILACMAGKHVYVEKPASHNILEGQTMLKAARKHNRVLQVGCQSRSGSHFAEAMEYIRTGALGKVKFARAWESARQGSVGHPADRAPPEGVDYDMWLGPAPKRAFNPLRFHSHWRWFFDYGTGDLGNDGVHRIDYARRALEAAFEGQGQKLPDWPTAVSASGGKLIFDDAQEWPDTLHVTWDYPEAVMVYEMRIWSGYTFEGEHEGAAVYGTDGYAVVGNGHWKAFDADGKPNGKGSGSINRNDHDPNHKRNFLDCIRSGERPNFDIEQGHVTSSMCHMANIAWRVGRKLRFDPKTHRYLDDPAANKFLTREYRQPWTLPVIS